MRLAFAAWLVRLVLVLVVLGWNAAAMVTLATEHAWLLESPWSWCGPLAPQSDCGCVTDGHRATCVR